ncbi:hypothetical protein ACJIZ3_011290 [Penstemon smallii]|uniref:Secreted protein n=1 Tax=Penstemon smallii TaxID=265156 RepID=A0ABD3UMX8_9LAMI
MQMEQLNLSPRISKTAPLIFFVFSLSSSWASVTPSLKSSCCRLAFSLSVIDSSHSIAQIFSTRPPPPHPAAGLTRAEVRVSRSAAFCLQTMHTPSPSSKPKTTRNRTCIFLIVLNNIK